MPDDKVKNNSVYGQLQDTLKNSFGYSQVDRGFDGMVDLMQNGVICDYKGNRIKAREVKGEDNRAEKIADVVDPYHPLYIYKPGEAVPHKVSFIPGVGFSVDPNPVQPPKKPEKTPSLFSRSFFFVYRLVGTPSETYRKWQQYNEEMAAYKKLTTPKAISERYTKDSVLKKQTFEKVDSIKTSDAPDKLIEVLRGQMEHKMGYEKDFDDKGYKAMSEMLDQGLIYDSKGKPLPRLVNPANTKLALEGTIGRALQRGEHLFIYDKDSKGVMQPREFYYDTFRRQLVFKEPQKLVGVDEEKYQAYMNKKNGITEPETEEKKLEAEEKKAEAEVKTEAKPEVQAEVKTEAKPEVKTESKSQLVMQSQVNNLSFTGDAVKKPAEAPAKQEEPKYNFASPREAHQAVEARLDSLKNAPEVPAANGQQPQPKADPEAIAMVKDVFEKKFSDMPPIAQEQATNFIRRCDDSKENLLDVIQGMKEAAAKVGVAKAKEALGVMIEKNMPFKEVSNVLHSADPVAQAKAYNADVQHEAPQQKDKAQLLIEKMEKAHGQPLSATAKENVQAIVAEAQLSTEQLQKTLDSEKMVQAPEGIRSVVVMEHLEQQVASGKLNPTTVQLLGDKVGGDILKGIAENMPEVKNLTTHKVDANSARQFVENQTRKENRQQEFDKQLDHFVKKAQQTFNMPLEEALKRAKKADMDSMKEHGKLLEDAQKVKNKKEKVEKEKEPDKKGLEKVTPTKPRSQSLSVKKPTNIQQGMGFSL